VTDAGLVITTANSEDAVDVLHLAGADCVLQLGELLGRMFAERILAPTARSSIISSFEDLVIAETSAAGTELVGCTLTDLDLRQRFGISVVGLWDRGELHPATPTLRIEESTILLLAGTREQVQAYDDAYSAGRVARPGMMRTSTRSWCSAAAGSVGPSTATSPRPVSPAGSSRSRPTGSGTCRAMRWSSATPPTSRSCKEAGIEEAPPWS
jgi:K+/H+ antiporter YhaU regulatory subunit KhtT